MAFLPLMLIYWTAYPDRLPINAANGIYRSREFGQVSLRDGTLNTGRGETRYVIESDKGGAFILPEDDLILQRGGVFVVPTKAWLLKMRLGGNHGFSSVEILDANQNALFVKTPDPTATPTNP